MAALLLHGLNCLDPFIPIFPHILQLCVILLCVHFYQEALEAYKQQNKFLSSELAELNSIRSDELEALRMSNQ